MTRYLPHLLPRSALAFCALLALAGPPAVAAGEVRSRAPDSPDTAARYLFYMHGGYIERRGSDGIYRYDDILEAFAGENLQVIGEARAPVRPPEYARGIAAQINRLIEAGVPPHHITVSGHSKGGMIALHVSAMVRRPEVRYAILAACGREDSDFAAAYRRFTAERARQMQGTFLVMWDEADTEAGDCDAAMKAAGVASRNVILQTGRGHRLFYEPDAVWMRPVIDFAMAN